MSDDERCAGRYWWRAYFYLDENEGKARLVGDRVRAIDISKKLRNEGTSTTLRRHSA